MYKVLFVCLGNICRSPAAEGYFIHHVSEQGLTDHFEIDSAGTSGFHAGEKADRRMREASSRRGVPLPSLSRKFLQADFDLFDLVVVMDDSNLGNVLALAADDEEKSRVVKLTDYCPEFGETEVPDPYYGGASGFEYVLDMVDAGAKNLLKKIRDEQGF